MENVGSQWLEAAQLKQRDSAVQMCALAALELALSTPICTKEIWAGNIAGDYVAIQAIRRSLIRSMSMEALLEAAGVDAVVLADFIQSLRKEG